ncbi:BspA family leucine-rich repeat surface protein [Campylobacter coli]|uniref:BspA family leucine-rich repeat surface protein n=1 Tax=Campylobacter coli TaxID=195 RepID=UPI001642F7D5|nr:BspA family leucine-rich repeat surface protein [Campylobacter coli]
MAQDLDTQLLDAIEALRKAPLGEWDAKKSAILELFDKGAKIPPHIIENLETYLSDLEQEYWDDKAVYAGRSVKDSDEYERFNILSKLNAAKDKKKSLNALFKVTKSTGVIHTPKNKAELKKLVKDKKIYLGDIDISKVTNFKDLFKKSKRRDFSGIETWDTSKVTDMQSCFEEAEHFNHNIESWNVSKVKNMSYMFYDAEAFNQPLEKWDMSSVKDVSYMFYGASKFNQKLDKWNVSKVESFESMLEFAENFDQSLESWGEKIDFSNTKKLEDINFNSMFYNSKLFKEEHFPTWFCTIKNGIYTPHHKEFLRSLLDKEISAAKIDISKITDMSKLCDRKGSFNDKGIESWDVSHVNDMCGMFDGCTYLNVNLSKWNVSNVTNMGRMFRGCENFNGDISSWNVSKVENMNEMFAYAESFNQDISKWDVSKVESMHEMFAYAENFNQDISGWNVSSKALQMCRNIFERCPINVLEAWKTKQLQALMQKNPNATNKNAKYFPRSAADLQELCKNEEIHLGEIDTSLLTDMRSAFDDSERKDFSGIETWDTSNVTNMCAMFCDAVYFNHDISSWDVSKVENMVSMFRGAKAFNQPLNSWNVSNLKKTSYMFERAKAFNQPLDKWNVSSLEDMREMFYEAKDFNQNLDSWNLSKEAQKNAKKDKHDIFHGTKLEANLPTWLNEQAAPVSAMAICGILKEMCDGEYEKGKEYFINYYNKALQGLKALLEKKKVNDKDLARIYALAMGEREFYKENTIGNCPLELLELIKKSATDPKIALKIGEKDKQKKMSFLDNAASVGRADIVKFLFDCGEVIEGMSGLEGLYSAYHRKQTSQENMVEILRLYKANGLKDADLDLEYGSLYILALEHGIFSKEMIEKELGKPLLECVLNEYMPEGWQYIEWFEYFASKDLSQEEKDFIVQDIKKRKNSRKAEDYLQRYKAILEKFGAKGIL